MSKETTERKRLTKVLIALALVLCCVVCLLPTLTACDTPATTAEANADFGMLADGETYTFGLANGEGSITVSNPTADNHGTAENPYVISTKEQWNAFADLVNGGGTNEDTVAVLGADIDFGGGTTKPIGNSANPFKGRFNGRKFKITNAVIGSAEIDGFTVYALFGKLQGPAPTKTAVIADLAVTGCTISGVKNGAALAVSAISGWGQNATYINVSVRNDISLRGVNVDNGYYYHQGLYPSAFNSIASGDLHFYRCTYVGTINHSGSTNAGYDCQAQGVFNATSNKSANNYTADSCYVDVVWNFISGEAQGGLFGHNYWSNGSSSWQTGAKTTMTNSVIDATLQGSATNGSANFSVMGYHSGGKVTMDKCYVTANMPLKEAGDPQQITNTTVTQSTNSLVYPNIKPIAGKAEDGFKTYNNDATGQNNVKTDMQTGLSGNEYFEFKDDGTVSLKGEAGSYRTYIFTYDLGADSGVTWDGDETLNTFTETQSGKGVIVTPLATKPERAGYNFVGWCRTADGTGAYLTGESLELAGDATKNITVYAIWEIKDPTIAEVSGAKSTLTYEEDGLIGWDVTLADAADTDVTVGYAWTKDNVEYSASAGVDGKNVSVVENGKITFTMPATTQSGAYKLTITLTPNGGNKETAEVKTIEKDVTFTVNKFQVENPVVPTNPVYDKDLATSVETTYTVTYANTADADRYVFTDGTTSYQKAGDHTTVATLNDTVNYAWKDNTGVDASNAAVKSITWNIAKAEVALPVITSKTFVYGATERSLTINTNEQLVNISGDVKATNAGNYTVTFTLVDADNYKWAAVPDGADNAEVASYDVAWTITKLPIMKPTLANSEMSYTDEILTNLPQNMTDGVTFVTDGTNKGEDVNTYYAEFYLLSYEEDGITKCNYRWSDVEGEGESDPFTIEWNIIRRLVKLPIIVEGTFIYSESEQTKVNAHEDDADKYYFVDNSNKGTSATNYTAIARLNDPANNRWEATTADGMVFDAANPETGDIQIAWSISKANISVLATPTQNGRIFVGCSMDNYAFGTVGSEESFRGGTAVNATHTSVPVAGHWDWEVPSDKLVKNQTEVNIKYVPADPNNYVSVTVPMSIVTTQLQVVVNEIDKNLPYQAAYNGAIISENTYDVDFGTVFEFAKDCDRNDVLAKYAGYSIHYYQRYLQPANVGDGELYNGADIMTELTVTDDHVLMKEVDDKTMQITIYVGYVAETVPYTVYHIYQRSSGGAPTPSEIALARKVQGTVGDDDTWYVEGLDDVITMKRLYTKADERVTAGFIDVAGFTATDSLNDDCRSRYMNIDIKGDGSSELYIYYARERHSVYWQLNGGRLDGVDNVQVKYSGAEIDGTNIRPTRNGYKFVGWYEDAALSKAAEWPQTMLDKNLNFYAKWEAIPHTISEGYNQGYEDDGAADTLHGYNFVPVDMPHEYSIDSFKGGKVITLPKPTAAGFDFVGWQYTNKDGEKIIVDYIDSSFTEDIYLLAIWKPATMTLELKQNNGKGDAVWRSIEVENFGTYPKLPNPQTRIGYEFIGWYTDPLNGALVEEGNPVRLTESQTLYAHWKALEYTFEFPEDYASWTGLTLTKNGRAMAAGSKVTVGDKIVMTLTPDSGYVVKRITIGSSTYTGSTATYTVQARTGTTIPVKFEKGYAEYNITLYNQGGRLTPSGDYNSYTKKFSIATEMSEMNLPDANDLARVGYEFGGWAYYDEEADPDHESMYMIDLTEKTSWEQFKGFAKDMTLYAIWNAASHDIVLDYNYTGTSDSGTANGLTGETISITSPSREDYTFVGWATTAEGAAEFAPTNYTEQGADLIAGPVSYTIPEVSGNITLYAKWVLAKIGFVSLSTGNNNCLYGNTITVTGTPYKMYIDATNVTITYKWYKVENLVQYPDDYEDESKRGLFDLTGAQLVGDTLVVGKNSPNAYPLNKLPTLDITKVNESGTYVCQAVSTDGVNTTEGHGSIEITMRKADFTGVSLRNDSAVYDGSMHKLALGGVTVTDNGEFTLPDGSVAMVNFTYYLNDVAVASGNSVKNVGNYTVKATFEFADGGDKGNYNLPDPINAFLNITPKTLKASGITFEMQKFDGTDWVALNSGVFTAKYDESKFRIVAKSSEIVAGDDVTIVLTQSANGSAKGEATDVGNYEAMLENLSGTNAENYVLGLNMPMRSWSITAGTRDMSNVGFTDVAVEFDEAEHVIEISGVLPDEEDITVEYSVVYTPYDSSWTGNVLASHNNGGQSAGKYVVTARFIDADENYNAIADMTATLTITQKAYAFSDAELGASKGVQGMIPWEGVAYDTDAMYKPTMGTLASYFDVTYKYEKQAIRGDTSSWADITETIEKKGGFNEGGMYRITAMLKFVNSPEMNNNYGAIADVVVLRDIADGVVTKIEVSHATNGYMYVYGDKLDMERFLTVTVYYAGEGNPSKKLDEYSSVMVYEYQNDKKGAKFDTFNRADENYKLLVEYYGFSGEISVQVGKASYNVNGVAFAQTSVATQFDGQNHLPVLANADGNYGIVGAESKAAVESANLKVTYWVSKKNANNSWSEKVEIPSDDAAHELLMHVGEYRVYVTISQEHPYYNNIVIADSVFALVTISPLQVVDNSKVELKWQYRVAGDSEWIDLGDKTEFDFIGKAYEFRMAFAGVGRDGDHEVTPAYKLGVAVASEVKDQGAYTLTATGDSLEDYSFTKSTNLTVKQSEVELIWKANSTDGTDGTLLDATVFTYTGADQLGNISVYYRDVNGAYVKIEGLTATDGAIVKDAKGYTLSIGEPADKNYIVKAGVEKTKDITVNPFVVKGNDAERGLVWQYKDADGSWKEISGNLMYKGSDYQLQLQFNGVGSDGMMIANVSAGEGMVVRNATNGHPYTLTAVAAGNYAFEDASVAKLLNIDKAKVAVTWNYDEDNHFTYNGQEQTVEVTAKGIGEDSATELLDKAAMVIAKKDVSANPYVANAQLTAEAAVNYDFADDAKLSLSWRIKPATLNFTWSDGPKYTFTYTGSELAPQATPVVAVAGDDTGAQYEVYRKVGEEWEKISGAITVGKYKIECVNTNTNYTLNGSTTATREFEIIKAIPVVNNVTYNEYADANKSYKNNTLLRDDKLSYDKDAAGAVSGTLKFENVENALATSANSVSVRWIFTPNDTENYETRSGMLTLKLEDQRALALEADLDKATKAYPVGVKFNREGIQVYVNYESCYYDKALNKYFGKRDLIEDVNEVGMTIDGIDTALGAGKTGYRFEVGDKGTDKTVTMNYLLGTQTLTGTFKVSVLKDDVQSIEILNKSELESLVLYEKFNYDLYSLLGEDKQIEIQVNYKTEEADTLNLSSTFRVMKGNETVSNGVLRFEKAGTYRIYIEYVENVEDYFEVTVNAKEDLEAVFDVADRIVLPESGSTTLPAPQVKNAEGLLEDLAKYGLKAVVKDSLGSQIVEITECRSYTVTVEFAFIDENSEYAQKYNLPANITKTFEVVDKLPYEVTGNPILGDNLIMDYTGEHVEYGVDKKSIRITLDGKDVALEGDVTVAYKINNVDAGKDYRLVNAGEYKVECLVSFTVDGSKEGASIQYTIVINAVENELSISIENWQEGFEPNVPEITAKFGDVSGLKVWFAKEEDGVIPEDRDFTSEYSVEAAKDWKAGETYWLKVTMAADANGNYGQATAKCSVKINTDKADVSDPDTGENIGTLTPSEPGKGVDPDGIFKVEKIDDAAKVEELTNDVEKAKQVYGQAYDITFKYADGSDIPLEGKMTLKLLISEKLRDEKELKVYYVDDEGNVTDMNATRDGDYMVFEVEHLSTYVITTPAPSNGGWIAGVTIGGIVALALVIAVVVIFMRKRKGA